MNYVEHEGEKHCVESLGLDCYHSILQGWMDGTVAYWNPAFRNRCLTKEHGVVLGRALLFLIELEQREGICQLATVAARATIHV
jgi:hypothetical protein